MIVKSGSHNSCQRCYSYIYYGGQHSVEYFTSKNQYDIHMNRIFQLINIQVATSRAYPNTTPNNLFSQTPILLGYLLSGYNSKKRFTQLLLAMFFIYYGWQHSVEYFTGKNQYYIHLNRIFQLINIQVATSRAYPNTTQKNPFSSTSMLLSFSLSVPQYLEDTIKTKKKLGQYKIVYKTPSSILFLDGW